MLEREDDLGDGFVMEWLDGITLGAKVVRDPELDKFAPTLARKSGEVLAKTRDRFGRNWFDCLSRRNNARGIRRTNMGALSRF